MVWGGIPTNFVNKRKKKINTNKKKCRAFCVGWLSARHSSSRIGMTTKRRERLAELSDIMSTKQIFQIRRGKKYVDDANKKIFKIRREKNYVDDAKINISKMPNAKYAAFCNKTHGDCETITVRMSVFLKLMTCIFVYKNSRHKFENMNSK